MLCWSILHMEEIVSIIKRRNNSYENLKFVDIVKIVEILSKIYDVYIDDVVFESDKNYLICYDHNIIQLNLYFY